jgi:hypothetical protein
VLTEDEARRQLERTKLGPPPAGDYYKVPVLILGLCVFAAIDNHNLPTIIAVNQCAGAAVSF